MRRFRLYYGEIHPIDCEFIQSNNFAFGGINTSIIIKRWA